MRKIMAIDTSEFRLAMGHFATGVTVVTSQFEGKPAGFTANAFTSVSLDPPLVLVCIDLRGLSLKAIESSRYFAVNIMGKDSIETVRCFARNGSEKYDTFCSVRYHIEETGSPILDEAITWVDCRVKASYPGGDHLIVLGEVVAVASLADDPLLYYRGNYFSLAGS
jgi:3-hydroxy-9,10-secoandrosta-1,3,5(10)-triene-9,17-dione monooxygenase reductase component